jgi:hypothetical protein
MTREISKAILAAIAILFCLLMLGTVFLLSAGMHETFTGPTVMDALIQSGTTGSPSRFAHGSRAAPT